MNQNKAQVELKARDTFSKRERLKLGRRERESHGGEEYTSRCRKENKEEKYTH